jgi:hypothetical protein
MTATHDDSREESIALLRAMFAKPRGLRTLPPAFGPEGILEEPRTDAQATPTDVRRRRTMARISRADAEARYMRQRRQAARQAGYRGPLTRAELAAQCARAHRPTRLPGETRETPASRTIARLRDMAYPHR